MEYVRLGDRGDTSLRTATWCVSMTYQSGDVVSPGPVTGSLLVTDSTLVTPPEQASDTAYATVMTTGCRSGNRRTGGVAERFEMTGPVRSTTSTRAFAP